MFLKLAKWPESRSLWLFIFGIAGLLELTALFFQYIMDLGPCVMCIYQRTAMLGLLLSGLVGAIKPSNMVFRIVSYTVFVISSIWGFLIAKEHVAMQTNTDPFAFTGCAFEPNFPEFLPLHHWAPWFFEVTGDCGSIDWQFLGLSMPQWMQVIFAVAFVVFTLIFINRLVIEKKL